MSRAETLAWKLVGALRRAGLLSRVNLVVSVTRRGRRIRVPVIAGLGLGHRTVTEPHLWPALVASLAAQRADGTLRALPDVRPWLWPRHVRVVLQSVLPGWLYRSVLVVGRPVKRVLGGAAPSLANR